MKKNTTIESKQVLCKAKETLKNILFAASEVSIISTDKNGRIMIFNHGAELMLGYTFDEIIGKQIFEIIHDSDEVEQHGQELSQEFGRPISGFNIFSEKANQLGQETREWTYIRKDKSLLTVSLTITAIRDGNNAIVGYLGIAYDITARKQAEKVIAKIADKELAFQNLEKEKRAAELVIAEKELIFQNLEKENRAAELVIAEKELIFQNREKEKRKKLEIELKRSNAELEQFAYAVSHDMRQPLRMVTSYLSLIEMALATQLDDDTRQFLTFAIEGAKRMDAMILSLLDYSRVGRLNDALTIISSRDAVDEALTFLEPALKESGGEINVSGNWIDLVARGDELTRLLQNLIGNALKYHEENKPPCVDVLAIVTSTLFRVEVRDAGIGIAPNQMDRLFKVFSRLQARSRFEGTGIGLALCRKIVEHHGGKIGVESAGEGLGSVFWFALPIGNSNIPDSDE